VRDAFIPADRTLAPLADKPCIDDVIARLPAPGVFSLAVASVAIGIAQGALDDIVSLATQKTPLLAAGKLAANEHFQFELARAETGLRAARALLYESAGTMWAAVEQDGELTLEQRAHVRAAAVWATDRACRVATTAYRAGGGTSLYVESPLQRRLRDVHAVTQHFLVRQDTLTTAGAVLAGQGIAVPVF
jgi:alkylation response protein AidB-like acyl-CoA dehydrogenase